MMIQLFNLFEDHSEAILAETQKRFQRRVQYKPSPAFKPLLARLLDGYVDMLVTGQATVLERVFRALVPLLARHRLKYSDAFALPWVMCEVVRKQIFEEYQGRWPALSEEERSTAWDRLMGSVGEVERTAQRACSVLLDLLQKHLQETVGDHNVYLQQLSAKSGLSIEPLRIERTH